MLRISLQQLEQRVARSVIIEWMSDARFIVLIEPGIGAGPVRLGMSESEVLASLGEPEATHADHFLGVGGTSYWYASCFQVGFDSSGVVGEIQLCSRGPVEARVGDLDLLNTPAEEVVARLSVAAHGEYTEGGYSFDFPQLRLGFWRQCLPGDEPDDDEQFRGGRFWDTVSTWTADYADQVAMASAALPPP